MKANSAIQLSNEQEEMLLLNIAKGNRDSFARLFSAYQPRIFKFVFRLTRSHSAADELTNDVLLTVWQDAGRFRAESKVSTWIFGIAYRKSLRYSRKRKFDFISMTDKHAIVDDTYSKFEQQDWVRQGIEQLPPKQKLTVILVYYLGLSCEETAVVTSSPVNTVKTRMFHARRKMKDHLVLAKTPRIPPEDLENE